MIVYPDDWYEVGRPVKIQEIEEAILQILGEIHCSCLALSGGLDSSLMLYYMLKIYPQVEAFTIGDSENHPDIRYSKEIVRNFENETNLIKHRICIPSLEEIKGEKKSGDFKGDDAVRIFYKFVEKYTDRIVSCDGADEFNAGYYGHQAPEIERAYYEYIRRLQKEQLEPLNKNSMGVKVYLPYLDKGLLYLLCQIPLAEKVNKKERKILMVEMAKGKIPDEIIKRRKIGFCDALAKGEANENKT